MQTKLDEAKAELLEQAARVAENSPVGGAGGYIQTSVTVIRKTATAEAPPPGQHPGAAPRTEMPP